MNVIHKNSGLRSLALRTWACFVDSEDRTCTSPFRWKTDMPTPWPYILLPFAPQMCRVRRPLPTVRPITLEWMCMVLACPCLALALGVHNLWHSGPELVSWTQKTEQALFHSDEKRNMPLFNSWQETQHALYYLHERKHHTHFHLHETHHKLFQSTGKLATIIWICHLNGTYIIHFLFPFKCKRNAWYDFLGNASDLEPLAFKTWDYFTDLMHILTGFAMADEENMRSSK